MAYFARVEQRAVAERVPGDHGRQHDGQGDRVGVRAEPRDGRDALLEQVADRPEERADDHHVRLAQLGQRGADVTSGRQVALLRGVRRCGHAAAEGDVRAEERAEGDVAEHHRAHRGIAGDGRADRGEQPEADQREGEVRAQHGVDEPAAERRDEHEQELHGVLFLQC
nr:hypothetical protein [Propionicimonas sp.]